MQRVLVLIALVLRCTFMRFQKMNEKFKLLSNYSTATFVSMSLLLEVWTRARLESQIYGKKKKDLQINFTINL